MIQRDYEKIIRKDILNKGIYRNNMEIPGIRSVILNETTKKVAGTMLALEVLTSQKPTFVRSKKTISSFNTRKGFYVGAKVTMRKEACYAFITKLIHTTIPHKRDSEPFPNTMFDKNGNSTISVRDLSDCIEMSYHQDVLNNRGGLDVTIGTTGIRKLDGQWLMSCFQIPIKE
jgi:large subunit ribosomal protein L5